jgi:hypothetical protein
MKTRWLGLTSALLIFTVYAASAAITDGYVVRVATPTIYLDWGQDSGVKPGDRFQIYRPGEALRHPVTHQILGRTDEAVCTGKIQKIEGKFSIGLFESGPGLPRVADRTRWLDSVATADEEASIKATSLAPEMPTLKEVWRSEVLEKDPASLAIGDVDGDGQKDVVIAYHKRLQVYRFKDRKLESLASYDDRNLRHWLGVEVADTKGDGHNEIYLTGYQVAINRPRVVVLRFENGALKKVADLEGFVRSIRQPDGSHPLFWQTLSRSSDLRYTAVSPLRWEKGNYKPGSPMDLRLSEDQLFGFAWGDFYRTGAAQLALLEHGERIRVVSPETKWKSSEVFGGTKNDFTFEEQHIGSLYPRLEVYRPAQADRDQLLVPTNIPDFGVRLKYLKIYKRSQIDALLWNGLEMKSAWRVPIQGYLADFRIADVLSGMPPQLAALAAGPGDKAVLLIYTLP